MSAHACDECGTDLDTQANGASREADEATYRQHTHSCQWVRDCKRHWRAVTWREDRDRAADGRVLIAALPSSQIATWSRSPFARRVFAYQACRGYCADLRARGRAVIALF